MGPFMRELGKRHENALVILWSKTRVKSVLRCINLLTEGWVLPTSHQPHDRLITVTDIYEDHDIDKYFTANSYMPHSDLNPHIASFSHCKNSHPKPTIPTMPNLPTTAKPSSYSKQKQGSKN